MKDRLCFLFLGFVLFFSCNAYSANKEKQISCVLKKDRLSAFFFVNGFFENDSGIYFYGLKYDTIFLYKENADGHFEFDFYIQLPKQYTEQYADNDNVSYIKQLIFINMDSIIIYHENHLALISIEQDSLLKKFYHSRDSDWYCFVSRNGAFLRWNKKRNTLPISIYRWDNYAIRTWRCDTEFMGEFSFEKDTFSFFPVKLPYDPYNNYLITDYYGESDELFAFNGDTFVIGFQVTPATYLYNAANNHVDSLYLQNSTYVPLPEADTARIRETSFGNYMHEAYLEHNFFCAILYDEYKQVYYRLFSKAMPLKNDEGLLNTIQDKEFGLTIFDKNLQIIGDVVCWSWKDYFFETPYYPTSKGLYGYEHDYGIIHKIKLIYEK